MSRGKVNEMCRGKTQVPSARHQATHMPSSAGHGLAAISARYHRAPALAASRQPRLHCARHPSECWSERSTLRPTRWRCISHITKREQDLRHKKAEALDLHNGGQKLLPFLRLPRASRTILCAIAHEAIENSLSCSDATPALLARRRPAPPRAAPRWSALRLGRRSPGLCTRTKRPSRRTRSGRPLW
jgi:hypothetical protein